MSTRKPTDDESSFFQEPEAQQPADSQPPNKTIVSINREELVEGSRPGNKYVRVFYSPVKEFRRLGPGRFEATEQAGLPHSPLQRKLARAKRFLIGAPISSEHSMHQRLNKVRALAVLSSDAISSVAYGTEASLAILVVAGAGALVLNLGIGLVIIALLAIVAISYRQTIFA